MKVNLSISKRVNAQGRSEIILIMRRKYNGKVIDIRAKSGIFILPKMYDAKNKTIKMYSANKLLTNEVRYHNVQLSRLNELLARISDMYNAEEDKSNIRGTWLEEVVNIPSENDGLDGMEIDRCEGDIYQLFEKYIDKKQYKGGSLRGQTVCIRSVARFEMYMRVMDAQYKNFTFNVDTVTRADIERYRRYLMNEKELSEKYPMIFEQIFSINYENAKGGNFRPKGRGSNFIYKLMKRLKSFFLWLNREGITQNNPFMGVELGCERYGTPFYITAKERDTIASTTMPSEHLETQRDIFIFQCLVGCRVGDLIRFTPYNIANGILVYTPHKTKDNGSQPLQARVPLHPKAIELIEKYKGVDRRGRLFPVITQQRYNEAIKKIFTIAGVTRIVEIRNSLTGELEYRPINEVASSHLARRTFVGNLYSKVADPNLIGKMSGHVDGSKAFARYRKIEDETLKSVIDLL